MLSGRAGVGAELAAAPRVLPARTRSRSRGRRRLGHGAADGQVSLNTVRDPPGGTRTDTTLPVAVQATPQRPLPVVDPAGAAADRRHVGVTPQRPLPVAIHRHQGRGRLGRHPDQSRQSAADPAFPARRERSSGRRTRRRPGHGRPAASRRRGRDRPRRTRRARTSRAWARRISASKRRVSASSTSR